MKSNDLQPTHPGSHQEPHDPSKNSQVPQSSKKGESVGGGLLVITGAKLWFMVGGALIAFGLPSLFSSMGEDGAILYGQYSDINNTLSIFSMMIVTGGVQAVSKWTSQFGEDEAKAQGAIWQLWWLMVTIGVIVGGGFIASAPWIAEFRGVPNLSPAYQAAGGVLFAYSIYVVFIGVLNGRQRFRAQAIYDAGFTTLKVLFILGAVSLGWGVFGAFAGFAIAAFLILLISALKVGIGPKGEMSPPFQIYGYALQVMAYTLVFNLIFKLDLLLMKPAALVALGAAESDRLMGIYNLALQVSRLPWQVTIAVTFVIFPLLSEATFSKDEARSLNYIRQTLRYLLILVGAACAGLFALPQTVTSLFPASYGEMSLALVWTAPAYLCFTLFNLCNTLLMSAGRATSAFVIGVTTVSLAGALYWLMLYSDFVTPPTQLAGYITLSGQIALLTFGVGLLLGLLRLWSLFGAPIPLWTTVRVLFASVSLWLMGQQIESQSKLILLVSLVGLGLLFFVILIALGEWSRDERTALIQKISRRRNAA